MTEKEKEILDALEGLAGYVEEMIGESEKVANVGIQTRIRRIMLKLVKEEER